MKKRSLVKMTIIRLIILAVVILVGTSVIVGVQYYNKMTEENRMIAQSFTRVATYEIDQDLIDESVKHKDLLIDWFNSQGLIPDTDLSADEIRLLKEWNRIYIFFSEVILSNQNFRSFQVMLPDYLEATVLLSVKTDGETVAFGKPFTSRPYRDAEEEFGKRILEADFDEYSASAEMSITREGDELIETAFFPVLDDNDISIAFCEMDLSITEVRTEILRMAFSIAAMVFIILAVGMIIYYYSIRKEVIRPVLQLEQTASGIVDKLKNGESTQSIDIHTGNEIDSLARSFENMEENLRSYIEENNAITAEKGRISAELNMAAKIQADMLPAVFPAFPDRKEFDLFASMTPAKEVGGDFYDFFLTDKDTLVLVIADVSEKGVPAALFMMRTMLMIESMASGTRSPSAILGSVNNKLCDNNESGMFVTIWLGILDLRSGILKAANAGHEYPIIRYPGGQFELFKDRHSFMAGARKNIYYKEYELELLPDTTIFLYTDGVPEAKNTENEMFRLPATVDALNRVPDGTPEELLCAVNTAVREFVKDAEQFDDLTMLCLHYNGFAEKDSSVAIEQEISVGASEENIMKVREFINDVLRSADCPPKIEKRINVAAEELMGNIVMYAYEDSSLPDAEKTIDVRIRITGNPSEAAIMFMDRGMPFDPLAKKDPKVDLEASKRIEGGLGIYISKKFMDHIHYEYRNGRNVLTIIKRLEEGEGK